MAARKQTRFVDRPLTGSHELKPGSGRRQEDVGPSVFVSAGRFALFEAAAATAATTTTTTVK